MLPILEEPAVRERIAAFTVENYHRLYQLGALAPRVELIRGALVEKMPKSPLHASIITLLHQHLLAALPAGWHARAEQPLSFVALDSEPEPDLAVVSGTARDYFQTHPATAALVVEVVVTSERLDRVKLRLYAEAGIPESWLVLAQERVVERYTDLHGGEYRHCQRVDIPASLQSTVFPLLSLPPAGIFPA